MWLMGGGMLVRCPNMCSGTRSAVRLAPYFTYILSGCRMNLTAYVIAST